MVKSFDEEMMVPIGQDVIKQLLGEEANRETMNIYCLEGRIKYVDMPCL